MNPGDIYNLGETKILQSGKANKTWISKSEASFRRIFKNRFRTKTCYPNRFLVDTLLVHSTPVFQTCQWVRWKGGVWAKWQKWEKWLACSFGCIHPIWNPFCTRYHSSSTSMHIPGPKDILSLKICSSWGMMGMSTDQIAEVFTMDAAKVVKILERAERATSKDRVGMENKMSF